MITQEYFNQIANGIVLADNLECCCWALFSTFAAGRAPVPNNPAGVFEAYSAFWTNCFTVTAIYTKLGIKGDFLAALYGLRIMAPETGKRASFHKYGASYTGSVIKGKVVYIEY